MKSLFFVLAFARSIMASGSTYPGRPAPQLTLDHILQAPAGTTATWRDLQGNTVVLEFWATWCPGCREAIPHWNHLVKTFQGPQIRFISITDESPDLVGRFLKDYPISGWIGIDLQSRTFAAFGIGGRPLTVLVDSAGVVRALGPPSELTSAVLDDLISGKPVSLAKSRQPAKQQSMPDPIVELMIRPAAPVMVSGYSPGAESRYGSGRAFWGMTFRELAARAYGIPEERIDAPAWCAEDRYDVAITHPGLTTESQAVQMRRALRLAFSLNARQETREMPIYELRKPENTAPKLRPSTSTASSRWGRDGERKWIAVPLASAASFLQSALGVPVFDETGMRGVFDFELTWIPANSQSLIDAVHNSLGLNLVRTKRPLEYLVVDAAVRPSTW